MKALFALVAVCIALLAAPARRNPCERDPESVRAGQKLYARHCAGCHGGQAQGHGRARSLRAEAIRNAPPEALFQVLTQGVMRRGMPSWAQLPAERRWQIISYLKSLR